MSKHRYKPGDEVFISGKRTKIISLAKNIDGGYRVDPPVQEVRWWHEDEMTSAEPGPVAKIAAAYDAYANPTDDEGST